MGVATASTGASLLVDQAVRGEPIHGLLGRTPLLHATDSDSCPLDCLDRTRAHAAHDDDLAVMEQAGKGPVVVAVRAAPMNVAMASSGFGMIVALGGLRTCLGVLPNFPVLDDAPLGFENQEPLAAPEVSRNGHSVHRWEGDLHRILFSTLGARQWFDCCRLPQP
jgi:hypothetical protein